MGVCGGVGVRVGGVGGVETKKRALLPISKHFDFLPWVN